MSEPVLPDPADPPSTVRLPEVPSTEATEVASEDPFVTCPFGHRFPREQLTVRNGQFVCPVCDRSSWATPAARTTWSRSLLRNPLLLLLAAIAMLLAEMITLMGLAATYSSHPFIGGSAWFIAGTAFNLIGVVGTGVGVILLIGQLRSPSWSRAVLSVPLLVLAGGAALLSLGDFIGIGFSVANIDNIGGTWQLLASIFEALFYAGLAGALGWAGLLVRSPDPS